MQFPVTLRAQPVAWAESIRPQLLRAINRLGSAGPFTAAALAATLPTQRLHDVAAFLDRLVAEQGLRRTGSEFDLGKPLPVPEESSAARKQQQMWNILRGAQARHSIDAATLALLASTASTPVTGIEADRYVLALVEGRYLQERSPGRFRLSPDRNPGPMAPRLMQVTFLVELNHWSIGRQLEAREVVL